MARRKQARRSGARGVPAWIWLLAGVVLGLALSAFVLMRQGLGPESGPQPEATTRPSRAGEEPVAQRSDPAPPKKPRYDFYTLLPEKEVVIPDSELAQQARAEPPAAPAQHERYLLQAGAFREARDAEAAKAQLALLGMVARVQSATIDGVTWHRVRLGPYADLRELEAAKRQLAERGVEAIAIKAPQQD